MKKRGPQVQFGASYAAREAGGAACLCAACHGPSRMFGSRRTLRRNSRSPPKSQVCAETNGESDESEEGREQKTHLPKTIH
ncbi:hypothetical protein NDU88_000142 [Pleurodeles waltl]|uniref:Uncharacterized protein n=1 Tax=Pleurodeles waltl TaxID=8319 RepID=A0AAV7VTS8_PLEWA|nr:hypothetical protein NDU88_000142 [Pleurodeles waltl]